MMRRPVAAVLALALFAGCSVTSPWTDVLETDKVRELKKRHTEPIRYKTAVALRVDADAFLRIPPDEMKALEERAGNLLTEVSTASAGVSAALEQRIMSPDTLRAEIDKTKQTATSLQDSAGEGKGPGFKSAAAKSALAEAERASEKLGDILDTASSPTEDARDELMRKVPEAAADYQGFLGNLSPLNEDLGDTAAKAQDAFNRLPEAAMAVDQEDWDAVKEKVQAVLDVLAEATTALGELAEMKDPLADRITGLVDDVSALHAPASNLSEKTASALDAGAEKAASALEALQAGKRLDAASALAEVATELERAKALVPEEEGAGALAGLAETLRGASASADGLVLRIASRLVGESGWDEESLAALRQARSALEIVRDDLGASADSLLGYGVEETVRLIDEAKTSAASAQDLLAAEAERLESDADQQMSVDPDSEAFVDVFVENLKGFSMFHAAESLSGLPAAAPREDFLAAAARADADFLLLMQPRRNDIAFLGFNANWYYNFLIWSFAWFASNYVPDESWESRITMDVSLIDVRSGETLFEKTVESAKALNLNDVDDGYHFLGIVTRAVDRDDLQSAYRLVLPAHLNDIRAGLIEDLAVEFKDYTETEAFETRRNAAPPAGFAVVAGVGTYASDAFTPGAASGREEVDALIKIASQAARDLRRVADALEAQMAEKGAMGASEGTEELRKTANLLEMTASDFLEKDLPAASRSLGTALDSLAEGSTLLGRADPPPPGVDAVLASVASLEERLGKIRKDLEGFAIAGDAADLAETIGILKASAEPIPASLEETAGKIGEKGTPLSENVPVMEKAVEAAKSAGTALDAFEIPTVVKDLETLHLLAVETLNVVQALEAEVVETAPLVGKLKYLVTEAEKAVEAVKALEVPEALKEAATACREVGEEVRNLVTGLEEEARKAEARDEEKGGVAQAAAPASGEAEETTGLLRDAAGLLDGRRTAEAAARLRQAAGKAGVCAGTLTPLVKDLPTLIGDVLAVIEDLRALTEAQRDATETAKAGAPSQEDLGDLPAMQRNVASEINKLAGTIDEEAGAAGEEAASKMQAQAEALRLASAEAEEAAQALELVEAPVALEKQKSVLEAFKGVKKALEALGEDVEAVKKPGFALGAVIANQEELIRQTQTVAEAVQALLKPHAAAQDAILEQGARTLVRLQAIPSTFPQARTEEPRVFETVKSAVGDFGKMLERGVEAAVMFRDGDALGALREQEVLLERLETLTSTLSSSVEGKRSHVDWIKETAANLREVDRRASAVAEALETGSSRFQVDGASEDANEFAAFLTDPAGAGFSANRVKLLLDGQATREGIEGAFDRLLANRVLPGDLFVFYFAGCGALKKVEFTRKEDIAALKKHLEGDAERASKILDDAGKIDPPKEIVQLAEEAGVEGKALIGMARRASGLAEEVQAGRDPERVEAYGEAKSRLEEAKERFEGIRTALAGEAWLQALESIPEARAALDACRQRLASILPPVSRITGAASGLRDLAGAQRTVSGKAEELVPAEGEAVDADAAAALGAEQAKLIEQAQTSDMQLVDILRALPEGEHEALRTALSKASKDVQTVMQTDVAQAWEAIQGGEMEKGADKAGKAADRFAEIAEALDASVVNFQAVGTLLKGLDDLGEDLDAAAAALANLPQLAAHDQLQMALTPAVRMALEAAEGLAAAREAFTEAEKEKAVDIVQTFEQDLEAVIEKMKKGREALIAEKPDQGAGLAKEAHASLEALLESMKPLAAAEEALSEPMMALQSVEGTLAAKVEATLTVEPGPEAQAVKTSVASLEEDAAASVLALEAFAKSSIEDDEARLAASTGLAEIAGIFGPAAEACAGTEAALKEYDVPFALERLTSAATDVKAILEKVSGLPDLPVVTQLREDLDARSKAVDDLLARIGDLEPSGALARAAGDLDALIETVRGDLDTASNLKEDTAAAVPEPARVTGVAMERTAEALERLEEASERFRALGLKEGRKKLAGALTLLQQTVGTIEETTARMENLFARFLLPYDAKPDRPEETALTLYTVGELVDGLGADNVLMIFDASFAPGEPARGLGVLGEQKPRDLDGTYMQYVMQGEGWSAIFAGRPGDPALQGKDPRGGILTRALLEGARGAADRTGDGKVSLTEIRAYLRNEVPSRAKAMGADQEPLMGRIAGDRTAFSAPEKKDEGGE